MSTWVSRKQATTTFIGGSPWTERPRPVCFAQIPRKPTPKRAVLALIILLALGLLTQSRQRLLHPTRAPNFNDKRSENSQKPEEARSPFFDEHGDGNSQQPIEKSDKIKAKGGVGVKNLEGSARHDGHHHALHYNDDGLPEKTATEESSGTDLAAEEKLDVTQNVTVEEIAKALPDFVFVPFEEAIASEKLDGWEDRWISDGEFDAAEYGRLSEPKIDFVYLWVNGSDQEFRATMLPYELQSVLNDPEGLWMASHGVNRYRDWDELRYSFRSVHQHAGHFRNKLQIVVNSVGDSPSGTRRRRQAPTWLQKAGQHGVEVVAQEDFIDKDRAQCLPTFNSLTIENQLFNLPSDVDHFYALSDDMLLGARHAPSDIVSPLFGPVMGFKTNSYSTINPPTDVDAKRFGEKPFLIYTSWLLNRRFGVRKRKGQGHFGHSLSRSIMKEAIKSFPRPELHSACKRFRGEPGFQLYSWYVSFHYLIERYREALIWSYIMLRSDADGDGVLSWSERQKIVEEIEAGTQNIEKTSFRKRHYYHAAASLEKAGLEPPQVNTNIQWTSLDGPVSMQNADCSDFSNDDCLGPGFAHFQSSASNPLFTSANVFDRAARQNPQCGDCLIRILLHQVRQGLSPLLPRKESQTSQREMVIKALMRYKYTIMDPTNQLFVMVTDADQVDSTLTKKYVRERKPTPGQICLNDDVSTSDEEELADTHQAITELLQGLFPHKAAWEK